MAKRQTIGVILLLGMFLLALNVRAEPAAFLGGFEDLPLMPGLVEDEAAGMEFDAPGGRIVEAIATGRVSGGVSGGVSRAAVLTFYASTLPQLGWRDESHGLFSREGEILKLEISENGGVVTVRFAVSPESGVQQTPK
ncbi:MAG: hypothetical protein HN403_01390 [Rhodospirillales bacterium]|jgi:hypothetical protein|nr:hypothetical protein [Rhodospirillales bacterium]